MTDFITAVLGPIGALTVAALGKVDPGLSAAMLSRTVTGWLSMLPRNTSLAVPGLPNSSLERDGSDFRWSVELGQLWCAGAGNLVDAAAVLVVALGGEVAELRGPVQAKLGRTIDALLSERARTLGGHGH